LISKDSNPIPKKPNPQESLENRKSGVLKNQS